MTIYDNQAPAKAAVDNTITDIVALGGITPLTHGGLLNNLIDTFYMSCAAPMTGGAFVLDNGDSSASGAFFLDSGDST